MIGIVLKKEQQGNFTLESDSPFDLIAKQFDENTSTTNLEKNRWILRII